jgi:hypothetical protein
MEYAKIQAYSRVYHVLIFHAVNFGFEYADTVNSKKNDHVIFFDDRA